MKKKYCPMAEKSNLIDVFMPGIGENNLTFEKSSN